MDFLHGENNVILTRKKLILISLRSPYVIFLAILQFINNI